MKISIAMATYNGAAFLEEQLQSFVDQTRQPDELIITDDGSTDETLDIIRNFAEKAPFKVWWAQNEENLGYAGNFNHALNYTTGDLVFLSDQDDVWFSNKIETIEQFAYDSTALVLMNDAALTDANLNKVGLTKLGQINDGGLSYSSFVMGCCAAIKRDMLDICLPIPQAFPGHDSWIVKFAEGMNRKQVYHQCLQYYRRHESNESQFIANRTQRINKMVVLLNRLNEILNQKESINKVYYAQYEFLKRVQRAKKKCDKYYISELIAFEKELSYTVSVLNQRIKLRTKSRPKRLIPALNLWMKGGYQNCSGLKSACRDILLY